MLLNLDRAHQIMEKYELSALVASAPENVAYSADLPLQPARCLPASQMHVILPFEKQLDPAIVAPNVVLDYCFFSKSWIPEVRSYGQFYIFKPEGQENLTEQESEFADLLDKARPARCATDCLVQVLDEKDLSSKRIGLDESNVDPTRYERIKHRVPNAEVVAANEIFREIRMVKTSDELRRMQRAADINEKAMETAIDEAKVGMTEKEVWNIYDDVVKEEGGKADYVVIRSGRMATPTFPAARDRALKSGDVVRVDSNVTYENYFSDEARTFVLGRPPEKVVKYYAALVHGFEKAVEAVKAGTRASAIFNVAVEGTKEAGIPHYNRHACGHGIGIECYDPPLVSASNKTSLVENTVVNLELAYYELGFGSLHIENTFRVTRVGCRPLQSSNVELRIK